MMAEQANSNKCAADEMPAGNNAEKNREITSESSLEQNVAAEFTSLRLEMLPEHLEEKITALCQKWLDWQCQMITGLYAGCVYLDASDQKPLAVWPANSSTAKLREPENGQQRTQKKAWRLKVKDEQLNRTVDIFTLPINNRDNRLLTLSFTITTRPTAQRKAIEQLLEWGSLWLKGDLLSHLTGAETEQSGRARLITEVIKHRSLKGSTQLFVDTLAETFNCRRVSIGFCRPQGLQIHAISHTSVFDKASKFIHDLQSTMIEAVDQKTCIVFSLKDSRNNTTSQAIQAGRGHYNSYVHANWSKANSDASIATIPLVIQKNEMPLVFGALTFERNSASLFSNGDIQRLCCYADELSALFHERLENQDSLLAIVSRQLKQRYARWSFSGYKKALAALSIILVTALGFVDVTYQVKASASIETGEKKVLVAPFGGYLVESQVRAGDLVKAGQKLAVIDSGDLQIELEKIVSEMDRYQQDYRGALAKYEKSEVTVYKSMLDQLEAKKALVEKNILRSAIVSPIDGVVVNGDLTHRIGAPLNTGEQLFEVSPLDNYQLRLEIDEFDLAHVKQDAVGKVRLTSLPAKNFEFQLNQVVPVAIAEDGGNYFPGRAMLLSASDELRPGMHGVAKISAGKKSLLWIWTHSLVDRVRLWFWSTRW